MRTNGLRATVGSRGSGRAVADQPDAHVRLTAALCRTTNERGCRSSVRRGSIEAAVCTSRVDRLPAVGRVVITSINRPRLRSAYGSSLVSRAEITMAMRSSRVAGSYATIRRAWQAGSRRSQPADGAASRAWSSTSGRHPRLGRDCRGRCCTPLSRPTRPHRRRPVLTEPCWRRSRAATASSPRRRLATAVRPLQRRTCRLATPYRSRRCPTTMGKSRSRADDGLAAVSAGGLVGGARTTSCTALFETECGRPSIASSNRWAATRPTSASRRSTEVSAVGRPRRSAPSCPFR